MEFAELMRRDLVLRKIAIFASLLSLSVLFLLHAAAVSLAADVPPPDILNSIIQKLNGGAAPTRTAVSFVPQASPADATCRMQPFELRLIQNDKVRSYSVLIDPQSGNDVKPHQFFVVLSRMTIDSDGSPRAYHPQDTNASGTCQVARRDDGSPVMQGICALEKFVDGGMYIFRDADTLSGNDAASAWADIWPMIQSHKLKSIDMRAVAGPNVPPGGYLFYWDDRRLTSTFQDIVVPKDSAGYPCVQGSESTYPGYLVAATALKSPGPPRADRCPSGNYLDSETVPFFVLPNRGFGDVQVGDIMVARVNDHGIQRIVYGLVGDSGPGGRLGEGSIALAALLSGKTGPFINIRQIWDLDVEGRAISILILGGTRNLLNGNYSRGNIDTVARNEVARWANGNVYDRLDACTAAATVNPSK